MDVIYLATFQATLPPQYWFQDYRQSDDHTENIMFPHDTRIIRYFTTDFFCCGHHRPLHVLSIDQDSLLSILFCRK